MSSTVMPGVGSSRCRATSRRNASARSLKVVPSLNNLYLSPRAGAWSSRATAAGEHWPDRQFLWVFAGVWRRKRRWPAGPACGSKVHWKSDCVSRDNNPLGHRDFHLGKWDPDRLKYRRLWLDRGCRHAARDRDGRGGASAARVQGAPARGRQEGIGGLTRNALVPTAP